MNPLDFPDIVLASGSPRRRELLDQLGVRYTVLAVDVDETPLPAEPGAALASRLAQAKALAGQQQAGTARPVLGSDTVVVVDGAVFGKPVDRADALRMLAAMSGREHEVFTAVALASAAAPVRAVLARTLVRMRAISVAEASAYWDSGEPLGKAGAYAIQGRGAVFIEHIQGSHSCVMGLPLYETARLLQAAGSS